MSPTPTNQFNRVFNDPSLTVDYNKAMRFIQLALKRFPHGGLKAWAAEQNMNYATLISVRNNTLRRSAPLQAQKVLEKLKFPTELIRVTRSGKSTHEYIFLEGQEAIERFHHQLKEYENTSPPDDPATAGK